MTGRSAVLRDLFMAVLLVVGVTNSSFGQGTSNLVKDTTKSRQEQGAELLVAEGDSLGRIMEYAKAYEKLDQALAIYLAQDRPEEAINTLVYLFRYALRSRDAANQVHYANRALSILNERFDERHHLAGKVFWQRGEAFIVEGKVDSAKLYFDKSAVNYALHEDWTETCWSKMLLAGCHGNTGHVAEGWALIEEVEALAREKDFPEEEVEYIYNNLLDLYDSMVNTDNDYRKAITHTQSALEAGKRAFSLSATATKLAERKEIEAERSGFIARGDKKLAVYFMNIGDFARSNDYWISAGARSKEVLASWDYNYNLGQIFLWKNEPVAAREKFMQSLEKLGRATHDETELRRRKALIGLSVSYKIENDYEKAMIYSRRAVASESGRQDYLALSSLATDYMGQVKAKEAIAYLELAEAAYKRDADARRTSQNFLADLYRISGESHLMNKAPETALYYFQKALISNHESFTDSIDLNKNPAIKGVLDPTYFLKALSGKAKAQSLITKSDDYLETSLATYQLVMQWMDSLQTVYSSENSQLDWSETFKGIYEEAIHTAYRSYQENNDTAALNLAFKFSEKSKNAILLEELKASEGRASGGIPQERLAREKSLHLELANLTKTLRFANQRIDKEKLKGKVAEFRLKLAALRDSLEREFPRYREIKYAKGSTGIAHVREEILDDQAAFLSYFLGKEKAYLFLLTREEAQMIDLGNPGEIRNAANVFLSGLSHESASKNNAKMAFERYLGEAYVLYNLILRSALTSLPEEISRLIIVPDGLLNAIPFSAITNGTHVATSIDFAKLPYLLYRFDVQYAFSATLQIESWRQGNALPKVKQGLIIAPQYSSGVRNTRGIASVAPLIGADKVREVIDSYMKVDFKSGPDATRENFIDIAKKYGLLHLSTHGGVNTEDRGSSHLVFTTSSKSASAGKDHLLYHEDIVNLDLSAQLVVLSACETGLGKYEDGEGVFSLGRSFTYAGVPSVVMSLWKVNDFTTSELMPLFYHQIASGEAKDVALRQAKLAYLVSADVDLRHPYYWSAFVSIGDSRPLRAKAIPWWYWVLGGLAGLVLGGLAEKWLRKPKGLVAR